MILPDRMFSADWIRDERLRRLPAHVQLLLLFIRHLCDRNGRFEFNPALIHMALYASAKVSNVSARDVEAWLEILRAGGYIKSYTGAAGRRVGEVAREYWRQKLSYGKDAFEPEAEQPELALPLAAPPAKKISNPGGRGKTPPPFTSYHFPASVSAPSLASAGGHEGAENSGQAPGPQQRATGKYGIPASSLTLAALQQAFPHLDVEAEARAAERRQRKLHGADYQLDLLWFAEHWLAKAGPKLDRAKPAAPAPAAAPIDQVAAEREMAATRARFAAMPEPEANTLAHAMWVEARKQTKAA